MKATEIMSTNVQKIKGSASVAQAIQLMRDKGVTSLVVERRHEEDAYGVITDTDIVYQVSAFGEDPKKIKVYQIMTKPCIAINPDLAVEYVARLFAQTGIRVAPVIQGELLGLISITDILHKSNCLEKPRSLTLEEMIINARDQARAICSEKGPNSPECASAWDIVEELQAEAAHQRNQHPEKTHFEEYCEEYPEAVEARIYES